MLMNAVVRLDYNVIRTLAAMNRSGEPDLLPTIVSMFIDSVPVTLDTLKRVAAGGDLRTLQRTGHDLKSSCASLGAGVLAARCAELEALARAGTRTGTEALVSDIVNEFNAVRPELEALLTVSPKRPPPPIGTGQCH
jgi:HPt (histidine-containing phosphotransfer) domain-containing protein